MNAMLDKAKGKLMETFGRARGDKTQEGKGHLEQAKGDAKDALTEVKEGADDLSS